MYTSRTFAIVSAAAMLMLAAALLPAQQQQPRAVIDFGRILEARYEGTRPWWDPARGIPLAVCPTSNLRLGVVPSLDAHPLRQLWEAGVPVSVNTDDPGFFGCDLVGEYAIAGRLLGLDRAGYARLARNSVESSFAPETVKAELRGAIADWLRGG